METTELLSISIASTLGYEKFVIDPIISLAKKLKVPAERLNDLMTIVGEAVANAIEQGNGENADLNVQIIVSTNDNALILLIIDQG